MPTNQQPDNSDDLKAWAEWDAKTDKPTGTVLITGNTFPVKEQLKALGAKWDPDAKGWRVPSARADEARAIVAGAPAQASRRSHRGSGGRSRFRSGTGDGLTFDGERSYSSSGCGCEDYPCCGH